MHCVGKNSAISLLSKVVIVITAVLQRVKKAVNLLQLPTMPRLSDNSLVEAFISKALFTGTLNLRARCKMPGPHFC
jgi:hypothetical protein